MEGWAAWRVAPILMPSSSSQDFLRCRILVAYRSRLPTVDPGSGVRIRRRKAAPYPIRRGKRTACPLPSCAVVISRTSAKAKPAVGAPCVRVERNRAPSFHVVRHHIPFVIRECSGALFYVLLIVVSCFAAMCTSPAHHERVVHANVSVVRPVDPPTAHPRNARQSRPGAVCDPSWAVGAAWVRPGAVKARISGCPRLAVVVGAVVGTVTLMSGPARPKKSEPRVDRGVPVKPPAGIEPATC